MSEEKTEEEKTEEEKTLLAPFEIPNKLVREDESETYTKYIAEPFETGYGQTLGNSLRRVLLSSLEGAAVTAVRIKGVQHEFTSLPGIVEDVVDIVLNLKKVRFIHHGKEPRTLNVSAEKQGTVTAADIEEDAMYEVVNPEQVICTLDQNVRFEAEIEVRVGRGFATGDENKHPSMAIGTIPIDSIFSPVRRVKYQVENTRVGQMTDFDKVVLEIWTDGRIEPDDALLQASAILRHHLDVFVNFKDTEVEIEESPDEQSKENSELRKLLNMSVNEIELSVRAANCLQNANIQTVGQLAMKTEAEMLKYRNFGKKSLTEIVEKLNELGLSLGMRFDPALLDQTLYSPPIMMLDDDEDEGPSGLEDLIAANLSD